MADGNAIHTTSVALRNVLRAELPGLFGIAPSNIDIDSIDVLEDTLERPRVTLFLFNIRENPHLKNRPRKVISNAAGKIETEVPPTVLDLDYMICAFTTLVEDEQKLLGNVVRVLYDHTEL